MNLLVQEDYTLKFIHLSLQEFFAAKFLMYLKENEKEYVYEILAQMENKYGGNQFMLETIAELYPNDFYDYFIPAHIRYCCISYEQLFIKGMYDNELYKNSIERYPYARRLIEKSENAYQIYLKFLEDYPKDTTLTSFALEFKDTPNENYAVEIQTLYRNHNILLQMLKDYSDSQTNATKKILDIVFDKSAKNTYKPFGGIRLPNSKD
ncbi:MAG: hypothetical protein IPL54_16920 [Chitinophagaceae bacterium]|nr:hypothetical protein [Chitinophagaceae bacterium]